jgi:hypothetical protein
LLFNPVNNTFEILSSLVNTLLSASDRIYMADHAYVRTIGIPVNNIGLTKFDLSKEDVQQLCQNGQKAAEDFFATWDFDAYKVAYRSNNYIPSRQERLHADMKLIRSVSDQLKNINEQPPGAA